MPIVKTRALYLAPQDDPHAALLALVSGATASVRLLIYSINLPDLVDTLIAQHRAGMAVSVVTDHTQAATPTERPQLERLIAAGVEVVIASSPSGHILHTKAAVVDRGLPTAAVGWGSYNFTAPAALENNSLLVENDTDMVEAFYDAFQTSRAYGLTKPQWQLVPPETGNAPEVGA